MNKKERVYEEKLTAMPPLKLILNGIPSADLKRIQQQEHATGKSERELADVIHLLINHIKTKL